MVYKLRRAGESEKRNIPQPKGEKGKMNKDYCSFIYRNGLGFVTFVTGTSGLQTGVLAVQGRAGSQVTDDV